MAFHNQPDQAFALLVGLRQELLGCGQDGFHIRLDLDLSDCFHSDCDSLLGVEVLLRSYVERHELQRKGAVVFDHRENDGAMALHDPSTTESIDDQRLMRPRFADKACDYAHQKHEGEHP